MCLCITDDSHVLCVSTAAAQEKAPWMYVTMMMTDQMLELPPLLNGEVPMMHHMINGDTSQQVNRSSTPSPPDRAAVLRWLMSGVFAGDSGPGEPRRDLHHPQRRRHVAVHPRSVWSTHFCLMELWAQINPISQACACLEDLSTE